MDNCIHRGDIFWVESPQGSIGSEICKSRPACIVSNEKNNLFSPNVEICYLTTAEKKKPLPTHVEIVLNGTKNTILCENVYTVSKSRLGRFMTYLGPSEVELVDKALRISLGLSEPENFPETRNAVQSVQHPERTEELESVRKRCIELQTQNQLYCQILSAFVSNLGGTAPC